MSHGESRNIREYLFKQRRRVPVIRIFDSRRLTHYREFTAVPLFYACYSYHIARNTAVIYIPPRFSAHCGISRSPWQIAAKNRYHKFQCRTTAGACLTNDRPPSPPPLLSPAPYRPSPFSPLFVSSRVFTVSLLSTT